MTDYARIGAKVRLIEILNEREDIITKYPELESVTSQVRVGRKRGYKVSEEARARMSAGQRKRFAKTRIIESLIP